MDDRFQFICIASGTELNKCEEHYGKDSKYKKERQSNSNYNKK